MRQIDIFNNSSIILLKKTPHKIINVIYIIVSFFIIMLVISLFYKYPKFNYYRAYIEKDNNDFIVSIVLEEKELPFDKGTNIWINQEKVQVEDIEVSNVQYDNMNNQYYIVKLTTKLNESIKINNNIVDIHIFIGDTTIAQELWKKIKKGMMR